MKSLYILLITIFFCLAAVRSICLPDGVMNNIPRDGDKCVVNGIPKDVRRYWMQVALDVQKVAQNTPCPFGAFGAVIVRHTPDNPNGTLICTNSGLRASKSQVYHGEISAILNCSEIFASAAGSDQGRNLSLWNGLSLYTTGESCAMCAGAIRWSRFGELIWGTDINTLISYQRQQIDLGSSTVSWAGEILEYDLVTGEHDYPLVLIRNVLSDVTDVHFAWQYVIEEPCPSGCHRDPSGTILEGDTIPRCIKIA